MTKKEIEEIGKQEYAKWRQEKNKTNVLTAAQLEEENYISMVEHRYSNEKQKRGDYWLHDYDMNKYDKNAKKPTQEYKVETPNGEIIKVKGPRGSSNEVVIEQAKQLIKERDSK